MKLPILLILLFTVALLRAAEAIRPKYLNSDKETLRRISQRGPRLIRRLRLRQADLSAHDDAVSLSATLSSRAGMALAQAEKKCALGDATACERTPVLVHRASVLERAARKAVAADAKRREELRLVETALGIAMRTYPKPSAAPRPEHEYEEY